MDNFETKIKKVLKYARQRCSFRPHRYDYKYYGGKGIKCFLTLEDVKYLWGRDNACLLDKPSLDRVNSSGNYELSNCRFIELTKNISLSHNNKNRKYVAWTKKK